MKVNRHELVAKLNAARLRRETLHGREYLVVPTTIMRPDSVMNGSKGPLFYPRAEVARNPGMWNGVPLLLNHPTEGSTGRDPRILATSGLGYLYNDRLTGNGNRVADAWFDLELVKRHDAELPEEKRMLPRLEGGKSIDVSTGLYTEDRPVKNGVKLKDNRGRAYTGVVATNYRPDHLAVLPTTRGACAAPECGTAVGNAKDALGHGSDARGGGGAGEQRVLGHLPSSSLNSHDATKILLGMHGIGSKRGQGGQTTSLRETKGSHDSIAGKLEKAGWKKVHDATEHDVRVTAHQRGEHEIVTASHADKKFGTGAEVSSARLRHPPTSNSGNPSSGLDMSPEKACQIVKDGEVHGHPLTDAQRGMFGALCGERGHAKNADGTCETCVTNAKDALGHGSDAGGSGRLAAGTKHVNSAGTVAQVHRESYVHPQGGEPRMSYRLVNKATGKAYGTPRGVHPEKFTTQFKPFTQTSNSDEGDDMPLTPKQKTQHVARITANCECWKGKEAKLNVMDDEAIVALSSTAATVAAQNEALEAIRETFGLGDEMVLNAETIKTPDMKNKMKKALATVDDNDEDDDTGGTTVKKNKAKAPTGNADDDALQTAIEDAVQKAVAEHPTVKNAERTVAKERAALRARLTVVANTRGTTPAKKTLILNKLKDANLPNESLEELLTLVGEPVRNARHPVSDDDETLPDYTGAGSGYGEVVGNSGDATENAEELAKFAADGGMAPVTDWGGRMKEVMNGQGK